MLRRFRPPLRAAALVRVLATLVVGPLAAAGCASARAPTPAPAPPAPAAGPTAASSAPATPATPAAVAPAPLGPNEHALVPATLDPGADKYPAPQYAYFDPKAPRQAPLVVYLVGAKNTPERGRAMGAFLAGLGFAVVVPGYANDYDIRALCEAPDGPDPDCHGKLRLEAIEGVDHSPHIAITPPNSLETRVARMLTALDKAQPAVGWGKYLAADKPRWDSIIAAGHSHGASSSGMLGKVRSVQRVVMLSGPFDNRGGAAAAWPRRPGLTPVERVFAFSHTQEEQYPVHVKNWDAMGLPAHGAVVVVETSGPPYAKSHQLVTSLPAAPGGNPHGTTAAGRAAPRLDDGTYRFEAVWRYLFGL